MSSHFMQPEDEPKGRTREIPSELPVLPLRNTLAYPLMVLPLAVGIPRSVKLIEDALQGDRLIGLVGMEDGTIEEPGSEEVFQIGTVARIHRVIRAKDETMQVIVQGIERFEVQEWLEPDPYLRARIEQKPDSKEGGLEMDALIRSLRDLAREVVALSPHLPDEVNKFLSQVEDPRHLIYLVAANARIHKEEGQSILEADDLKEKFRIVIRHLSREKDLLTLEQKIQTEAHEEMDKAQREYFLRQQLKAIRKELGDEEEISAVLDEYREKLHTTGMPAEARKEVMRELKRLDGLPPQAAEYGLIKTYIDWMVEIPWAKKSEDQLDIEHARAVLDEDHYDLEDVKSRILEYLAVRKLIGERDAELEAEARAAAKDGPAEPVGVGSPSGAPADDGPSGSEPGSAESGGSKSAESKSGTSEGAGPRYARAKKGAKAGEKNRPYRATDKEGTQLDDSNADSDSNETTEDDPSLDVVPRRRMIEDVIGVLTELPDDEAIEELGLADEIEHASEFGFDDDEDDDDYPSLEEDERFRSRFVRMGDLPPKDDSANDDEEEEPDDSDSRRDESRGGTILCFAGPPGVGKTSLGQSIARALGRKFTRMSLGGMRDEAEIRGHRRTYIGALPGRIMQALKRAGTRNPVFMLDEVDKIGSDWRGDPASALLEVLDPAQNHAYRDHYLDVDFDLSDVIFIATANNLETIPDALRDRMEIIQLEGYTDHDKLRIAQQYLVPRQRKANGLRDEEVIFKEDAIRKIIRDYTRESGVRELERQIGTVCRKVAVGIAEGKLKTLEITPEIVRTHLKAEKFHSEDSEKYKVPGVATGLAVTAGGGDILFIEATQMKGKGGLTLTGHLGDVMKESAQIAFSYVRSKAAQWPISPEVFEKTDVHVHVPAGAIPKDGPSAGVAMVAAMVSLLTGAKVRHNVGMTGEVTLRGRVLPVGGVKTKVLAAHRAGLDTVVLPKRNEPDLENLPEEVRKEMTFVPIEQIEDGLGVLLEPRTATEGHPLPGGPAAGTRIESTA